MESTQLMVAFVAQIRTSLEQMRLVASEDGNVEQRSYVHQLVDEVGVQIDNLESGVNSPPDWNATRVHVRLPHALAMKLQTLIRSIRKTLGIDILNQGVPRELVANALASVYTLEFEIENQFPELAEDEPEADDR
jgi:hypothetical protein